jgi:hypothetical protein
MGSINRDMNHDLNRGIELMLRRREKTKTKELQKGKFIINEVFSFFKREIKINFELSIRNKK